MTISSFRIDFYTISRRHETEHVRIDVPREWEYSDTEDEILVYWNHPGIEGPFARVRKEYHCFDGRETDRVVYSYYTESIEHCCGDQLVYTLERMHRQKYLATK